MRRANATLRAKRSLQVAGRLATAAASGKVSNPTSCLVSDEKLATCCSLCFKLPNFGALASVSSKTSLNSPLFHVASEIHQPLARSKDPCEASEDHALKHLYEQLRCVIHRLDLRNTNCELRLTIS